MDTNGRFVYNGEKSPWRMLQDPKIITATSESNDVTSPTGWEPTWTVETLSINPQKKQPGDICSQRFPNRALCHAFLQCFSFLPVWCSLFTHDKNYQKLVFFDIPLPETNSKFAAENQWLKDELFPLGMDTLSLGTWQDVSFRECMPLYSWTVASHCTHHHHHLLLHHHHLLLLLHH